VFFNEWDPALSRELAFRLRKLKFNVGMISYYTSRSESRDALNDDVDVILCDDILSRGISLPRVSHVINYHQPLQANIYIHRAGRTCRFMGPYSSSSSVITLLPHKNTGQKRALAKMMFEKLKLSIHHIMIKDQKLYIPNKSDNPYLLKYEYEHNNIKIRDYEKEKQNNNKNENVQK